MAARIKAPKVTTEEVGKWGMMRYNYLKDWRKGLYREFVKDGYLIEHLQTVNRGATEMMDTIMRQRLDKNPGVPEGEINMQRLCFEEVVRNSYIYPEASRD